MRARRHNAGTTPVGALYVVVAACALAPGADAIAADARGNARILYYEPFKSIVDTPATLPGKPTRSRQLTFEAYGRRFDLALEPNDKLQPARPTTAAPKIDLYRGRLSGIDGSWARIATQGALVHGLIWDGQDLYVIEPGETVRDSLLVPLPAYDTIVFRASDTIIDGGVSLCAVGSPEAQTGKSTYAEMIGELSSLKRGAALEKTDSGLRLELSAIGDAKFRAQYASEADAIAAMLLRLNNVDGIFTEQLGIEIQVPTTYVFDAHTEPLSPTTSPNELLKSIGAVRKAVPEMRARGLSHLFTGRDLDGPTVGIGYIGTLCSAEYGVALTESRGRGAWLESLIAAHEIGHNFGAVHDGSGQCSATPENQFLMSPTVTATSTAFSKCSRDLMKPAIAGASCVTSLPPADLSIAADLGTVHGYVGRAFEWRLSIANQGGRPAEKSRIELIVPPTLTVSDAWVVGGACASGAGTVVCQLGDIPGGASRSLNLTLHSDIVGSNSISAQVTSVIDAHVLNNSGSGTIVIDAHAQEPTAEGASSTDERKGGGGSMQFVLLFALAGLRLLTALRGPADRR